MALLLRHLPLLVLLTACGSETFRGGGDGLTITIHHADGDATFNWPGANKREYKSGSFISPDPISFMWRQGSIGTWGPTVEAYESLGMPYQTSDNPEQQDVFWLQCDGQSPGYGWEISLLTDCNADGEAVEIPAVMSFCETDGCDLPEEFDATISWTFARTYTIKTPAIGAVPNAGD